MAENDTPPPTGAETGTPTKDPARPRKVYESTLLPERRRRRVSPLLAIPALFLILIGALVVIYRVSHARRHIDTVGEVVYSIAPSGLIAVPAGGVARPLPAVGDAPTYPVFAPDGNQIAYLASHGGAQHEIFVEDADGKAGSQATRSGLSKDLPAFSPTDYNRIAYLMGGALYVSDISAQSTERVLPPAPTKETQTVDNSGVPPDATVVSYAWMPALDPLKQGLAAVLAIGDTQRLAIVAGPDSQPILTLNGDPKGAPIMAASDITIGWMPGGEAVGAAVIGAQGPNGKSATGIFRFTPQGQPYGQAIVPQLGTDIGPENPVFTPDGQEVIFQVWKQPDMTHRKTLGVYIAPMDGGKPPHRMAPVEVQQLRIDPVGRNIYFLTKRPDGGHDLMFVSMSGGAAHRISDGVQDVTGYTVSPQAPAPAKR